MLRTYSNNISATANSGIIFNNNKISTNRNVTHTAGSPNVNVNCPGYYQITLDAAYTTAAEETTPVTIQLYADNVAIPDAIITANVTTGTVVNNSFTTIIRANPGVAGDNVNLSIIPNANLTITNISLGVQRISNL